MNMVQRIRQGATRIRSVIVVGLSWLGVYFLYDPEPAFIH